jgi:hypothetical protein
MKLVLKFISFSLKQFNGVFFQVLLFVS